MHAGKGVDNVQTYLWASKYDNMAQVFCGTSNEFAFSAFKITWSLSVTLRFRYRLDKWLWPTT